EIPDRVFSDPSRIRQMLINVVGNAVKFTASGGVTIEVTANEKIGEKTLFIILVRDTGVGLNDEQKERLIQPFMQADNSTTRKYGGTGLGLALSKRLANAIGGDIFIEDNQTNQIGCTFGITFAAALPKLIATQVKTTEEAPKNKEKSSQLLSGIRVLLADDSSDNQVLVGLVLRKQGATVDSAKNGVEAFKMGMTGSFDIVLMDIQMPEMDGYEATRALRDAGFKKPIIALTAHAMAEERARTLAAGCDGHLTKPLNQNELIETIKRLTSHNKIKSEPRKNH
ncbi:MAG: response regulator, partial [Bdellovibrionaceae bacterium]|nr:response regulator [Pseudobdellovibrionaceae bacterium]